MIINDPVFGFIEVPEGLMAQLVRHPLFVRLSRLKQLGPTHYVYPGATHTRFEHSLGAFHLVCQAVGALGERGVCILEHEQEGVMAAMLLHDLGHGPLSHTLEHTFLHGVTHEDISLMLMERMGRDLGHSLQTAIDIYRGTYPKRFLHELVCSQLDMDRLDYLCRDSFFTGVREGIIGVARIIKMLDVKDDQLVVEQKGIYTLENYLMARRLMYWQVYLHKTALAAAEMLTVALERAKELVNGGIQLPCSPSLLYFLKNDVTPQFAKTHPEWLDHYVQLDDAEIETAMKCWAACNDPVLARLAAGYTHRHLFKAIEADAPVTEATLQSHREQVARRLNITLHEASYLVRSREIGQTLYSTHDDHISILMKDGSVRDISRFSELLSNTLADRPTKRYYLFQEVL
ncbi:MAG: HD domain-containing protein [Bacteroidaceae bacterium]|nr:HD domain-containing protein [Bacteroidaceae bacterium]